MVVVETVVVDGGVVDDIVVDDNVVDDVVVDDDVVDDVVVDDNVVDDVVVDEVVVGGITQHPHDLQFLKLIPSHFFPFFWQVPPIFLHFFFIFLHSSIQQTQLAPQ